MYCVSLGNKVTKWFSNRKDAVRYLALVNLELNSKLHELNYIYGYVFAEYRRVWFYIESRHSSKDQAIRTQMHYIDNAFKMACDRSHFENGNYFTFNNLYLAIESMQKICDIIKELLAERKFYADVHRLEMFQQMLSIARNSLDEAGENYKPISEQENGLKKADTLQK